MSKILVTGGCGYIGSHTIVSLLQHGHEVVCLDSLINASENALDGIKKITGTDIVNHKIDLVDGEKVDAFMHDHGPIDGVIHFAALKAVGESVEKPGLYHHNNVVGMINLLNACMASGTSNFIFSSSCTVYGEPEQLPVNEHSPIKPAQSPYGRTKQIGELLLEDLTSLKKIRAISLRYFNPAGGHSSGFMGESPINPPLNLVPIVVDAAAGRRGPLTIFGDDYDTRDGTCVRDYIHVEDLARAHVMAFNYLTEHVDVELEVFNLGTGQGTSVREVIDAFQSANGVNVPFEYGTRRPGDVPAIYSDNAKASSVLGWQPKFSIEHIMKTAWLWSQNAHPQT